MSTSDKRRRDVEREKAKRQEQRRRDAEARRRRRNQITVAVIVGALVLTMAVGIFGSLSSGGDPAGGDSAGADTDASAAGACEYIDNSPDPSTVTDVGRPPADPGTLGELTATMTLNGEQVVLTVEDQGPGFDHQKILAKITPDDIYQAFGRGLVMLNSVADKLDFNERGNKVVMTFERHED